MERAISREQRLRLFFWLVVGCIAVAVGYIFWVILRDQVSAALLQPDSQGSPLPIAQPYELEAIQNQPHVIVISAEEPTIGQVKIVALDPGSHQVALTALACGRVYYAAGIGICLNYDDTAVVNFAWVTLFGSDFKPRYQFKVDGVISRTRVSPDGRYAAFTMLDSGHSYTDINLSTSTVLLDTATGESLGNLEDFTTWKDGHEYRAIDFNFWGVTFAQESNRFYATLKNADRTYLVQGDIAARTLTVLHENVECPSLSPDGTRIAFKKLTPSGKWQLTVLEVETMNETPLAVKDNIDDQVEWLDNQHILYQKIDYQPPKWVSVFVVPADGSGQPEVFIPDATSPAVIR
jgi:hypothetical protein